MPQVLLPSRRRHAQRLRHRPGRRRAPRARGRLPALLAPKPSLSCPTPFDELAGERATRGTGRRRLAASGSMSAARSTCVTGAWTPSLTIPEPARRQLRRGLRSRARRLYGYLHENRPAGDRGGAGGSRRRRPAATNRPRRCAAAAQAGTRGDGRRASSTPRPARTAGVSLATTLCNPAIASRPGDRLRSDVHDGRSTRAGEAEVLAAGELLLTDEHAASGRPRRSRPRPTR